MILDSAIAKALGFWMDFVICGDDAKKQKLGLRARCKIVRLGLRVLTRKR